MFHVEVDEGALDDYNCLSNLLLIIKEAPVQIPGTRTQVVIADRGDKWHTNKACPQGHQEHLKASDAAEEIRRRRWSQRTDEENEEAPPRLNSEPDTRAVARTLDELAARTRAVDHLSSPGHYRHPRGATDASTQSRPTTAPDRSTTTTSQ